MDCGRGKSKTISLQPSSTPQKTVVKMEEATSNKVFGSPYVLTKQEKDMLDPDYKKPKRKVREKNMVVCTNGNKGLF